MNTAVSTRQRRRAKRQAIREIQSILVTVAVCAVIFMAAVFMVRLVSWAIDKSVDNSHRMLCNSAQVSGNQDYLDRCQHFYQTGDVTYLREE